MKKAEKEHLNKVAQVGCIVCIDFGHGYTPCEIHHPRHGQGMGMKSSHFDAIGLCHRHHRTGGHGVALHAGQKTFEDNFGTEAELLAKVKARL